MISLHIFLLGLLIVSVLTGLVTEAIKKLFDEHNRKYMANTLAGVIAVVLSIGIGIAYIILAGVPTNAQIIVYLIALIFLSWLSAMVGYDKVIQAISQFKIYDEEDK
ncbi:MAG: aminopeptidase [Clostridiales bacterium]|nr:aminopeptidase [Clostridiales bacterium]